MTYEPLHHKYRPQTFADLVGQSAIATTLSNALISERIAPAYLFTGPRGTGKTSSARILAKSLNCLSSDHPTPIPCGKCSVCQAIANGSALDVIEIDAASNTGVDNIREIIERSQFAPVQCRYKVYVIDECLTGDSLVFTETGLIPINHPEILGKRVLSYNESSGEWEYKKVLRWLNRGGKATLTIQTRNRTINCTGNHLIRTEKAWIQAKNLKIGDHILSPVNVAAVQYRPSIIKSPQWLTNFEEVIGIQEGDTESVYDLEVEDNHNFVANGLLVHNCHMLSTAAFNALLKTLEEPPDRVGLAPRRHGPGLPPRRARAAARRWSSQPPAHRPGPRGSRCRHSWRRSCAGWQPPPRPARPAPSSGPAARRPRDRRRHRPNRLRDHRTRQDRRPPTARGAGRDGNGDWKQPCREHSGRCTG